MNADQLHSLVRSLLKIAGAVLAARGLTACASLINSEDVCGVIVLLAGVWQSHQHHATLGSTGGAPVPAAPTSSAPGPTLKSELPTAN
jgi:hypothetical protein